MTKIASFENAAVLLRLQQADAVTAGTVDQAPRAAALAKPASSGGAASAPTSATRQATTAIGNAALSGGWQKGGAEFLTEEYAANLLADVKAMVADWKLHPDKYERHDEEAELKSAARAMLRYRVDHMMVSRLDEASGEGGGEPSEIRMAWGYDIAGDVFKDYGGMSESELREAGEVELADKLVRAREGIEQHFAEIKARLADVTVELDTLGEEIAAKYRVVGELFVTEADGRRSWGTFELRDKNSDALLYSSDGDGYLTDHVNRVERSLYGIGW